MLVLRWSALGAVALLALAASYAAAWRLRASCSAASRWMLAGLLSQLLPYSVWWGLSFARAFTETLAPLATAAACGLVLWRVGPAPRHLAALARRDARKLLACYRPSPTALLFLYPVTVAAGFALVVSLAHVVAFPTWSWDCVWYHLAQTRFAIQERSVLFWADTHLSYANAYPRLVEATAAFATLVLRAETLDDSAQLAWGFVGAAGIAGLARSFQLPRPLALGLGLAWLVAPAVALQLHTTHADVAAGAQFIALCGLVALPRYGLRAVTASLLAAGALLATKISGLLLVALVAPFALARLVHHLWRRRRSARRRRARASTPPPSAADAAAALPSDASADGAPERPRSCVRARSRRRLAASVALGALALALGVTQPLHNALRTGNPFYPASVTFLGRTLPGTIDEEAVADGRAFFRSPGSFARMLRGWYQGPGLPFPDIREHPFGDLFGYGTLPLALLGVALSLAARQWRAGALLVMAAVNLMVPAAWWGRFVLGVPAAALVGAGLALGALERRSRALACLALALLGYLAVADVVRHAYGYRHTPSLGSSAALATAEARLRGEMNWMFAPEVIAARDAELGDGDVWAYDESVAFLGEHWNRRTTSRAVFVSSDTRSPDDFVRALDAVGAAWVSVRRGSAAERAVALRPGASFVTVHRHGGTTVLRWPARPSAAAALP